MNLSVNYLLLQIKRLDKRDQRRLFNQLTLMIQKSAKKKNFKLSSISGLGSSIWSVVKIDEYLDQEREW
ncbi:hypothetical protein [Mucilaginibacter flavus]|uniref:hypothetical protein n=1 Tax=Mucilaginibacter flavus TaxID=931504 RepID=UPI0025B4F105|nr:hypothetical protein [Mucilaginibacter flavus]MDN3584086.1 hypothetical protein [Mucilaginibacter flavus]